MPGASKRQAFSLIELVIVLVILGAVAAIAIPRMTKGAQGADAKALLADLATLRKAIEFYRSEHNDYPSVANIAGQLTQKTNPPGMVGVGNRGPYLVAVPPLKTGANKGQTSFAAPGASPPVAEVADKGWLYDQSTGEIWANDINHFDK